MKRLIVSVMILSSFSGHAGAGTILKAMAKPFQKVGNVITGKSLPSKTRLVQKYLGLQDVKLSRLDEITVLALSSGGSGVALKNTESKLVELEFRSMDMLETFDDLAGQKNPSPGLKSLFISQINDLSFLLAHMHVVVSKNKVYPHAYKILEVIKDMDTSLSGAYISSPSYGTKKALEEFDSIRKKVYLDLVDLK